MANSTQPSYIHTERENFTGEQETLWDFSPPVCPVLWAESCCMQLQHLDASRTPWGQDDAHNLGTKISKESSSIIIMAIIIIIIVVFKVVFGWIGGQPCPTNGLPSVDELFLPVVLPITTTKIIIIIIIQRRNNLFALNIFKKVKLTYSLFFKSPFEDSSLLEVCSRFRFFFFFFNCMSLLVLRHRLQHYKGFSGYEPLKNNTYILLYDCQ